MAKSFPAIFVEQEIYLIEEKQLRSLLNRFDLFSPYERNYCQNKPTPLLSIAGLWCAKQAFAKAISYKLGLCEFNYFNYLDLEIRHHPSGQPIIELRGSLASWFQAQNISTEIAIAHTEILATAIILFWRCKI